MLILMKNRIDDTATYTTNLRVSYNHEWIFKYPIYSKDEALEIIEELKDVFDL